MDSVVKSEIERLAAETIAIQVLLSHILDRIYRANPDLRTAIRGGFDDAANDTEYMSIRLGKTAEAEQTVKALSVIEELRTATLGDHDKPRHAV